MKPSITILLVEDEAIIAMSLQRKLVQAGYSVIGSVSSGEEALKCVEKAPPDLILMDQRLAGALNGVETAKHIHMSHTIPVIFMSGYQDKATIELMQQVQNSMYLGKPISMSDLEMAIETMCK